MFGCRNYFFSKTSSLRTSTTRNEVTDKRPSHEGFVLPYVLVAIAVMSLIITISAQRLQNISVLISQIQDDTKAEMAFMNAETEILYTYLTGFPTHGGMQLVARDEGRGGEVRNRAAPLFLSREQDLLWRNVWSGRGETRRVETPYGNVMASYRDVSGLVDLNAAKENILERLIISFDVQPSVAKALAATLVDYRDLDDQRKLRGAEAIDYRLRQLQPPTNSPLKSYSELNAILHWSTFLDKIDMHRWIDVTTLADDVGYLRYGFADEELLKALGLHTKTLQMNLGASSFLSYLADEKFPSDRARFTLIVRTGNVRHRKRIVEFKRELSGLNKPFERFWIYDTTVLESADNSMFANNNGLKNVFQPASYSSQ